VHPGCLGRQKVFGVLKTQIHYSYNETNKELSQLSGVHVK